MPTLASSRPPIIGPTMRLALLAPTSSDIALPICAAPTASPIITRRTGLSVAQPTPLMKLASARCQMASSCRCARIASASDVITMLATTTISVVRRSMRSAIAPMKAPNRPIGSSRSMVIMATMKAEPVCW